MENQKYYFEIKKTQDSFTVDIDTDIDSNYGIFIQFVQETDYVISITVHDDDGIYIGEVRFGYNRFSKSVFLSKYISSINALILDKDMKKLTFKIYTLSEMFMPYELKLDIQYISFFRKKNYLEHLMELSERLESKDKPLLFYKVEDDCYHPTLSSRTYSNGWKYYRGDFHGHSTYSDGNIELSDVSNYMKSQKMDFMAMTEHNAIPFVLPKSDCLMIPSFELTLPFGHLNIHGIDQLLILDESIGRQLNSCNNSEDYPINALLDCYKGSTNISINHMFMEPWDFTMLELNLNNVNTLEVICDPTYPTASIANNKAVAFIDFLWNKGIHVYGIGGSDCHLTLDERYDGASSPSVYGDPGTYVYSENLSAKGIIESVKKGMSYVARFCELDLMINQGAVLPGQLFCGEMLDYHATIRPFLDVDTSGWEGLIIMDGRVVKQFDLRSDDECHWQIELDKSGYHWIRFGVMDANKNVICYVNPVYCGEVVVENYRLKELLEEFNS